MSLSATFSQQYSGLILLCYELIEVLSECELTYCESILFRGAEISSFEDDGHIRTKYIVKCQVFRQLNCCNPDEPGYTLPYIQYSH